MGGVLRKASDESGHGIFRARSVTGEHRSAIHGLHIVAQRSAQQGGEVVREIGGCIVVGLAEAAANVVRFGDVSTKLERVLALDPAKVVDPVVDRSDSRGRVLLAAGVVNESEPYIVAITVAALRESLASVAVMQGVYESIADEPSMPESDTHWMIPLIRGRSIRISRDSAPCVVLHAAADKQRLFVRKVEVQLRVVRMQMCRSRRIEPEATRIQSIANRAVVDLVFRGGRGER